MSCHLRDTALALISTAAIACSGSGDGAGPDADCSGGKCDDPGDAGATDGPAARCAGEFPARWIDGDCPGEPEIQVHRYDRDTFILRQSLCTSFEAPFLYLLFGERRVLLEDTGDGGIALADTVDGIIEQWSAETGQVIEEIVVVNSHGHGDHVAGNSMFEGRADTAVVGFTVSEIADFFQISWPAENAEIDLGGRLIDLIPIPGHQVAHVALWDDERGLLLTGDTLYPGRLFINDFPTYRQSIAKLIDFTASREVCHVLGTHIEMSRTPGDEYALGAQQHPDEHELRLDRIHLIELDAALEAMAGAPTRETHDDFVIVPL